jgi:hypothetical protein
VRLKDVLLDGSFNSFLLEPWKVSADVLDVEGEGSCNFATSTLTSVLSSGGNDGNLPALSFESLINC